MNHRYLVAQLGARMHYAVPRILHGAGRLEQFHTDFVANCGWPRRLNWWPRAVRPTALQRLLGRVPAGVPAGQIVAYPGFGLRYAARLRNSRSASENTAAFLWSGREFCRRVVAHGFGAATGVYTFNSAGLEILRAAHAAGLRAVMEQTIAPKAVERQLLAAEAAAFPDWEADQGRDVLAEEYAAREQHEWQAADTILCGSEFVREGIARCGGPVEKCVVIPYGVDVAGGKLESGEQKAGINIPPSAGSRSLRVLTVGAVGLRKGSPYVLAAAEQLRGVAEFRLVGPLNVSVVAQARLRAALELTGPVPRSAIAGHFAWADVFLLPSICEGSATVTYEALAQGLPVICTPNTGSVVRDGCEGFIVPAGDAPAIVDRLKQLRADPVLRAELGANACVRAADFTVAAYGRRLLTAL